MSTYRLPPNEAQSPGRFVCSWAKESLPDTLEESHSFSRSRAVKPFVSSWQHSQVVHASQFPFWVVTPDVFSCSAPACVFIHKAMRSGFSLAAVVGTDQCLLSTQQSKQVVWGVYRKTVSCNRLGPSRVRIRPR